MSLTGHEVATMRRMLGWTRPEFASLIGASESAVRRWEHVGGEAVPLEARFEDVALILRDELHRDAERVREVLHEYRRDGLRALFHLLALRYGSPFAHLAPLPRPDLPV